jgi:hypothetical protein
MYERNIYSDTILSPATVYKLRISSIQIAVRSANGTLLKQLITESTEHIPQSADLIVFLAFQNKSKQVITLFIKSTLQTDDHLVY